MKIAITLLILAFSFSAAAQPVKADERMTERLLAMLSSLDSSFSSGTTEGAKIYGAQLECTNALGDLDVESMNCYLRSLAGFSVSLQMPVQITGALASDLKNIMLANAMKYTITNDFVGIGSKISCVDNLNSGDGVVRPPNTCTISRVY